MESIAHIAYQSSQSGLKVITMRILRFLQTTYLLQLMFVISVTLTTAFGKQFYFLITSKADVWQLLLFGYLTGYFFTLIFFSQLDARSRFQNYKLLKDKFFEYGFDMRLLKPFVNSRCQRDAIAVAAHELKYDKEWKQLNRLLGFRWFHILPHIVIQNPKILLTRDYWNKTLFVRTYHSKYFLW
jgi:hypothetical protein